MLGGQFTHREIPDDSRPDFIREFGDIQTAVITLVDRLAPIVPLSEQPDRAREIARVIASRPSSMSNNMFVRQSFFRRGTASPEDVVAGLTAWVTVLFDLANLQQDRARALPVHALLPDADADRLARAISVSTNGCILALPHCGSLELFMARLVDHGFDMGFVYTIGKFPTPTEQWIYRGRTATRATGIPFGRRHTGPAISEVLRRKGVVVMIVDVYPSDRYHGVQVQMYDGGFNFPPGPARFARSGTLVLPGFVSRRNGEGFEMRISDPLEYPATLPVQEAAPDFTQKLAASIEQSTTRQPGSYWLWHPIPNDPYLALAQKQRPDLLDALAPPNDEQVALAIEALNRQLTA